MKLWEKGYSIDKEVEEFSTGNDYLLDKRLVRYDCIASIAHAKMLGKIGILSRAEARKLEMALRQIIKLDSEGKFVIKREDEDCHTAIENYLTSKLGKIGKKIHTGRSRNDQVAVALRLYYKDELLECQRLANGFVAALGIFGKRYGDVKLPGYTHTRKAMPSSMRMWSEAIAESMRDNIALMRSVYSLIDQSPLGTGAGYGVPLEVDRTFTARELGFKRVQNSPIYVQNSRGKFEYVMINAMSTMMLDLNKMAQDLIIFSMPEFGYFVIPDSFTTGSSIMPQKKNPDALEILRASYHVVSSYESQVRGIVSNLPSGYNRDLQLTKEPTMMSFDVAKRSLKVASVLVKGIKADKKRCREALTDEVYATERAYALVKKGMPFREAYKKAAEDLR